MDTFAQLAAADRKTYFDETASRCNSTSAAIQKDFWICWCLKRLFELPDCPSCASKVERLFQKCSA